MIADEIEEATQSAKNLVGRLLKFTEKEDPVSTILALAYIQSSLITTIGGEGLLTLDALERIQPIIHDRLVQEVTALCEEARNLSAI